MKSKSMSSQTTGKTMGKTTSKPITTLTNKELEESLKQLKTEFHPFNAVIPVSQRGIEVAKAIGKHCNLPFESLESASKLDKPSLKLLLVDDISRSGATMDRARAQFQFAQVKTLVIAGKADYAIYPEPTCIKIEDKAAPITRLHKYWFFFAGFLATLWILLRSGLNPRRITYPCQRAALPLATLWVATVGAFMADRFLSKALLSKPTKKATKAVLALATLTFLISLVILAVPNITADLDAQDLAATAEADAQVPTDTYGSTDAGQGTQAAQAMAPLNLPTWTVANPVSTVFVATDLPPTSGSVAAANAQVPDANLVDPGMDLLIQKMAAHNLHLLQTPEQPSGIIHQDATVVIKCNFQWEDRSGTNNDRIKGLIQNIISHPEGFTGEILVVDNTQMPDYLPINHHDNNSQFKDQSVVSVVETFAAKGYPVYLMNLGILNDSEVKEYSEADPTDGYVYCESEHKISYPKFTTPTGRHLSMRYGVWSQTTKSYDRSQLALINMPILKAHIVAGATEGIKNWAGLFAIPQDKVDSRYGGFNSLHDSYFFGDKHLLPALIDKVRPDLTIIDASWINALNHNQRADGLVPFDPAYLKPTNTLVASQDPLAASWYSTKYILTPYAYFKDRTNPDLPKKDWHVTPSDFGPLHPFAEVLSNWETYFAANNLPFTRDPSKITVH